MNINDFVKGNIDYHNLLAPAAWKGSKISPQVRYKLLQTAKFFIDYLDIPNFRVLDVVLTGSMANYNYTKYSDFDVHVVTRYQDLECNDLAEAFYRAKKEIWNNNHDIVVHGHDVELYVEDAEQPPVSEGIYSLLDDKWLNTPKYSPPDIDKGAVNHKVQDLIKQIDVAIKTADDPEDLQRITDKLRHMRRSGLDRSGEFSVENLAFKVLRNQGYIDKLYQAHNHQQDQNLSL